MSVRDARAAFAQLIDRAARGETTYITRRGKRVAMIGPPEQLDSAEDTALALPTETEPDAEPRLLAMPGTGKTHLLAEVLRQLGEADQRHFLVINLEGAALHRVERALTGMQAETEDAAEPRTTESGEQPAGGAVP